MHKSPLTRRAAGATWWSTVEIASRYGVQLFITVVLARLLQPADFGLIAMLLVFTSIGAILVDSGFGVALVQRPHVDAADESTAFLFSISAAVLVALTLWMSAPVIAAFYHQPPLLPLTRLMTLVLPFGALGAVPDALLTRRMDFKARARAEILASLGSACIALVLALRGFGVWSLAWQAIAASALRAVLLLRFAKWRPALGFSQGSFRKLFSFGGYMLLAGLLDAATLRLQSLLIGRLFSARSLGFYTLAQNTQQAPMSFMGAVLYRVGLPAFSSVADQPAKLLGALRLALNVSLFIFIPAMVGLSVVARPLIELVYGPRWSPAAPVLTLLALAAVFWPLHVLNLSALIALGRSHLVLRLEVVKKSTAIAAILACSPFGPVAIAWSVLASSLLGVFVNTWFSRRLIGYGPVAQLRDQRGTLVLAIVAALAGWSILHWMPAGLISLTLAILIAAVCYFGGALLFRVPALGELIALMRTMRSPDLAGTQWEMVTELSLRGTHDRSQPCD
jgi:O-antigen/teichoic acid export membrane protein